MTNQSNQNNQLTIHMLIERINANLSVSYEDFLAVQEEIETLAADGNPAAQQLEDLFPIVRSENAFKSCENKIRKTLKAIGIKQSNEDISIIRVRTFAKFYIQAVGYKNASGLLPKSLHEQLFLGYEQLRTCNDPKGIGATLRAKIYEFLSSGGYDVSEHDPLYEKGDYIDFLWKVETKEKPATKRRSVSKASKGGSK